MPMILHVGLTKKVGQPDYGSLAASCAVDFEADPRLLEGDLEGFHQRVRSVYAACRQAIQDELARQTDSQAPRGTNGEASAGRTSSTPGTNGNGEHANGHATNGNGHRNGTSTHGASEKQLNFARQLAKGISGLGVRRLETLAQKMYSKPLAALTSFEASGLIDTLKALKDGQMDLESVLEGSSP